MGKEVEERSWKEETMILYYTMDLICPSSHRLVSTNIILSMKAISAALMQYLATSSESCRSLRTEYSAFSAAPQMF